MIRLNGTEYTYQPGMSLIELVDYYNTDLHKTLAFDGFIVLINGKAITGTSKEGYRRYRY